MEYSLTLPNCLLAAKGDLLGCGFFFAVLLNFKHIYMYLAVSLEISRCAIPSNTFTSAGVLHLSAESFLHDTTRSISSAFFASSLI